MNEEVRITIVEYSYGLTPFGVLLIAAAILGAIALVTVAALLWRGRKK